MTEAQRWDVSCSGLQEKSRAEVGRVTYRPCVPGTEGTAGPPPRSQLEPKTEGLSQSLKGRRPEPEALQDGIFQEKRGEEATSWCWDLQLRPEACAPWDLPPAGCVIVTCVPPCQGDALGLLSVSYLWLPLPQLWGWLCK